MSDFDPDAYVSAHASGGSDGFDPDAYVSAHTGDGGLLAQAGRGIMSGVSRVGSAIDSYTGAPMRATIGQLQNDAFDPGKAASAFANQFGNDPSLAPTGQDIVERAGVPKGSTAAKVAGFGMDLASNPVNFLPVGEIVGGAAKGVGGLVGLGAKGAEAAADAAPAAAKAPGALAKAGGKVAETMTGVDQNLAANYISDPDRINALVSEYKLPDGGYAEADHAADIRNKWNGVLQGTRKALNDQISTVLNDPSASEAGTISATPMMEKLSNAIDQAHPVTQAQDIKAIQGMQDMAGSMVDANGDISLKDLHALKVKFQDLAAPTYDAGGNPIFPGGKFAAQAAKQAAGSARQALIAEGPSEVSSAEAQLSKLHGVEDTMNSSLLKPEASVAALSRAGTAPGGIDARTLQRLSDITGYNFGQDAQDFATARQFANPKFTPQDMTGKSLLRSGIGAATGYVAGRMAGIDPLYSAAAGGALSSPGMLKAGINAGNMLGKATSVPFDAAGAVAREGAGALSSPLGKAAIDIGAKSSMLPAQASGATQSPPTGEERWARSGIQKLGIPDDLASKLLLDPKAKKLLIQASDYPDGSRGLKTIMSQIQKGWATQ